MDRHAAPPFCRLDTGIAKAVALVDLALGPTDSLTFQDKRMERPSNLMAGPTFEDPSDHGVGFLATS